MARPKIQVDLAVLQDKIDEQEKDRQASGNPFRSRSELYEAIAETDWAKSLGLTPVVIYLRVRDNDLQCQTPERSQAGERKPRTKSAFVKFPVNEFLQAFADQGIEIEGVHSIITSDTYPKEQNVRIQGAWKLLRQRYSLPVPEESRQKTGNPGTVGSETPPVPALPVSQDSHDEEDWDGLPLDDGDDEGFEELSEEEFNAQQDAYDSNNYEVQETDPAMTD